MRTPLRATYIIGTLAPMGRFPRRRMRAGGLSVALLLALSGCASYAPEPLGHGHGTVNLAQLVVPASSMPVQDLAAHRFDPADGLDVTETAMLAVVNNPQLKVMRDQLGVARAQAFAAGLLPDPQLAWSRDLPSSGQSGLTSAYSLGLSYDIGNLLTRSARVKAADKSREQVHLDLLWAEWQTVAQARLLFDHVASSRAQEAVLTREVAALQPLDRQVRVALASGNLSYDGAAVGLNAMADAQRRLAETTRQRQQAESDLRSVLGLSPRAPLDLVGAPYGREPSAAQLQQALQTVPARRPDLLALRAGYAAQEQRLREAVMAQFPAINIGINRARDTSDVTTHGFSIGITLPLFNRNRGNIAIEKATRQQLHDDYDARLLTTRNDMHQLQQGLTSLQAQTAMQAAHARRLDAARAAARQAWQANLMDWPTYLSIRGNALSADLDLLALRQQRATQAIALETLLGGDWTDRAMNATSPSSSRHK